MAFSEAVSCFPASDLDGVGALHPGRDDVGGGTGAARLVRISVNSLAERKPAFMLRSLSGLVYLRGHSAA